MSKRAELISQELVVSLQSAISDLGAEVNQAAQDGRYDDMEQAFSMLREMPRFKVEFESLAQKIGGSENSSAAAVLEEVPKAEPVAATTKTPPQQNGAEPAKKLHGRAAAPPKGTYTEVADYYPFLLRAFLKLRPNSKFREAQEQMIELMKAEGVAKPADLEVTGASNAIRYLTQSAGLRAKLQNEGLLEGSAGSGFTLTTLGRKMARDLEPEDSKPKRGGRKKTGSEEAVETAEPPVEYTPKTAAEIIAETTDLTPEPSSSERVEDGSFIE